MSTDLPRPDVTVTEQAHTGGSRAIDVVISRDGKAKSYSGVGPTSTGATKEAIDKILNDPHTAEWLPRGG